MSGRPLTDALIPAPETAAVAISNRLERENRDTPATTRFFALQAARAAFEMQALRVAQLEAADAAPAPEARVREFLEACPDDHIATVAVGRSLTVTDLRDVLAELDAARAASPEPVRARLLDVELTHDDTPEVHLHLGHPDNSVREVGILSLTIDEAQDFAIDLIEHAAAARRAYLDTQNTKGH